MPGDGPAPEGGGPAGGSCADDEWPQYGHDANRTSTSRACVKEPLNVAWKAKGVGGAPSDTAMYQGMSQAIAASGKVFAKYYYAAPEPYTVYTYIDALDLASGARSWTWQGKRDGWTEDWPAYGLGQIAIASDGLFAIDPAGGKGIQWHEDFKIGAYPYEDFDYWGMVLFDDKRLYAFNTTFGDGLPAMLEAFTSDGNCRGCGKRAWRVSIVAGATPFSAGDPLGGLTLDAGLFFYTSHAAGSASAPPRGLYAIDAATGAKKWNVGGDFKSHISAWGGRVYGVDGSNLVAFAASDGARLWSKSVSPCGQAPAIAPGGKIILATAGGVQAFDGASGAALWSATVPGVTCTSRIRSGSSAASSRFNNTAIAIAGGNGTVVVTGSGGVTLLDLETGKQRWSGGGVGTVRNPVLVGSYVIVTDGQQVIALKGS